MRTIVFRQLIVYWPINIGKLAYKPVTRVDYDHVVDYNIVISLTLYAVLSLFITQVGALLLKSCYHGRLLFVRVDLLFIKIYVFLFKCGL